MKKILAIAMSATIMSGTLAGCADNANATSNGTIKNEVKLQEVKNLAFDFEVNPVTFEIAVISSGVRETISEPLKDRKISGYEATKNKVSWTYPDEKVDITIEKKDNYLNVGIKSNSEEASSFSWPVVSGESYTLPLYEGKLIPSEDDNWKTFLDEQEFIGLESLSMQFFAVNKAQYSIMYMIDNKFNNQINFDTQDKIKFAFNHDFTRIDKDKTYGFKICITEKNINDIAKTYKNHMLEKGEFKTLAEKAKENPNIEKLYGAPHIYFWEKSILTQDNIRWEKLKRNMSKPLEDWIKTLLNTKVEDGKELIDSFDGIKSQDYIDNYQKNQIVNAFNKVLQLKDFYNPEVFTNLDESMKQEAEKINTMNRTSYITFNKKILKTILGESVDSVEVWAKSRTTDVLDEMKASGLENAWIGFDDIASGFVSPELVAKANQYGYLIAPYDSYHSIHKPGEEKWSTAAFKDTTLYENATVENEVGEKEKGFQGEGRKLNATLSLPSVKERVANILNEGYKFNSWFIDVDATGEIHDDYSKEHPTTQAQDLAARIERMAYIKDHARAVIGSEGGNDFASTTIAFSHGLETPAFSWVDKDMSKNKESEYYVGKYYSPNGGVPEVFAKQVPLKQLYREIFVSPKYSIPLFKLVYNESVINSYQWLWGTFKMKDDVTTRMMKEVLYNTAPMYHIDRDEWDKHKAEIIKHNNVWSVFNKKAIQEEMTNFEILTEDNLVQKTQFGNNLTVVANFKDESYEFEGEIVKPQSLIIKEGTQVTHYAP